MFAASKSGRASAAAATDPYFRNVPLLLETTSTNGQQNNTFLDSSTNNFTITSSGTPTQGSVTPYWPNGYWSNYFIPTSQIGNTSTSVGAFGSNNFTVECWFYAATAPTASLVYLINTLNGASNNGWQLYYYSSGWGVRSNSTNFISGATTPPVANTWNHVAWCRNDSTGTATYYLYVNGVRVNNNDITMGTWTDTTIYINNASGNSYTGYISNVRLVNGVAVYAAGNKGVQVFTPPSLAPLQTSGAASAACYSSTTNVNTTFSSASTTLLTCQSNRFKDNSTSPITLTLTSTPLTVAFQPFSPPASYTAAAYGGSGYLNGTTDYLTTPTNAAFNFGAGDFTIEAWVYVTGGTTDFFITSATGSGGLFFGYNNATTSYGWGRTAIIWDYTTTGATKVLNSWQHIAIVRSGTSGGTVAGPMKLYINGTSIGAGLTSSQAYDLSTTSCAIGSQGAIYYFPGNISNLRVVKGVPVYTGNFTPPTLAPLTTAGSTSAASYSSTTNVNTSFASSATSLLVNFTNAGIYDAAVQNNGVTAGSAQTSITQYKWSPTSMRFNGTTDYLTMPVSPGFAFGTGNFTIEAWIYNTSGAATSKNIFSNWGGASESYQFYLRTNNRLVWQVNNQNSPDTAALAVSVNAWNHVAWTRSGSTAYLHINGVLQDTTALTNSANGGEIPRVGAGQSGTQLFSGYIQDLRVTKGIARYGAVNFTPPTAAFPTR